METMRDLSFLDSKITAYGDGSHEIKRRLLLGRKAMTNTDSILESTDITLPTKIHLVTIMVFPVVMYGSECWTVKKTECQRIDAFFFFLLYVDFIFIFFNWRLITLQYCGRFCHTFT